MKHFGWLVVLLGSLGFAQGVRYDSVALNPRGAPIPNATITLCTGVATGTPCSPAALGYTDITTGVSCASGFPVVQQIGGGCTATTDGNGNFGFWLVPGTYKYSISGPSVATPQTYTITVPVGATSAGVPTMASATITGALTAGSIEKTVYADQQAGADICAQIVNAAAALPAGGGIVDATAFQGVQPACTSGTMVLGSATQNILVRQGSSTITTNANPGLKITDGAAVTWVGVSSNSSELLCTNTTASAPCVQWIGSRGGMERMWVSTNQNTGVGMILDASLSTSGVRFNTFKDMRINVSTVNANTQNGVQLNAQDGTHLVSFNNFINDEVVSFSTCYSLTMQGGGSVGPTDNMFLGGQCRETTAGATGTGINIGQAAQNNWFFGGNISDFVTAINIAAFSTTNQNKFYAVIMESNTNSVTIGAGSTDNAFIGCLLGSQTFTDNGSRTVLFGDGNNNFGPGGAAIQKQGAPWLNPTLISTGGNIQTIQSAASTSRTATLPDNTGTIAELNVPSQTFTSTSTLFQAAGSGTFFQLFDNVAANSTDPAFNVLNGGGGGTTVFEVLANGAIIYPEIASAPAAAASKDICYPDSTLHALKCSYNNGTFFQIPQVITATSAAFATATTAGTCVQNVTAVTGATTAMAVAISPVSTPGIGAVWSAFVSSAGNVTINECAVATSAGGTIAFNIRVTP